VASHVPLFDPVASAHLPEAKQTAYDALAAEKPQGFPALASWI
jgi:hypothetical protein